MARRSTVSGTPKGGHKNALPMPRRRARSIRAARARRVRKQRRNR